MRYTINRRHPDILSAYNNGVYVEVVLKSCEWTFFIEKSVWFSSKPFYIRPNDSWLVKKLPNVYAAYTDTGKVY